MHARLRLFLRHAFTHDGYWRFIGCRLRLCDLPVTVGLHLVPILRIIHHLQFFLPTRLLHTTLLTLLPIVDLLLFTLLFVYLVITVCYILPARLHTFTLLLCVRTRAHVHFVRSIIIIYSTLVCYVWLVWFSGYGYRWLHWFTFFVPVVTLFTHLLRLLHTPHTHLPRFYILLRLVHTVGCWFNSRLVYHRSLHILDYIYILRFFVCTRTAHYILLPSHIVL